MASTPIYSRRCAFPSAKGSPAGWLIIGNPSSMATQAWKLAPTVGRVPLCFAPPWPRPCNQPTAPPEWWHSIAATKTVSIAVNWVCSICSICSHPASGNALPPPLKTRSTRKRSISWSVSWQTRANPWSSSASISMGILPRKPPPTHPRHSRGASSRRGLPRITAPPACRCFETWSGIHRNVERDREAVFTRTGRKAYWSPSRQFSGTCRGTPTRWPESNDSNMNS